MTSLYYFVSSTLDSNSFKSTFYFIFCLIINLLIINLLVFTFSFFISLILLEKCCKSISKYDEQTQGK